MRAKLTALLAGALLMLGTASAWALPSEWGVINPTSIAGAPTYNPATDYGYYIWTDEVERQNWHIRWMDGVNSGITGFKGAIELQNNTGVFASVLFESTGSGGVDILEWDPTNAFFNAKITTGQDGIDFTITKTGDPSYVGFDLFRGISTAMDPNYIFIGSIEETVASLGGDQDFAIPAPVPEPGTMLLLGAGFLGLAIYGKRRKNA